ncbi:hypothetical protein BHE74_00045458 [Ensete ventricosum]|nr:hypothetical protein BHE74_00045458 [Ensete ventricosum]
MTSYDSGKQLIQSATHQSAPPTTFPQTKSPVAPNRETSLEAELPRCQVVEAHAASSTVAPTRSQNRSCDPVQTGLDLDTLSSDTVDSLREQVRQVHQRLDEVQKEVIKSREEIGESSKGGSPVHSRDTRQASPGHLQTPDPQALRWQRQSDKAHRYIPRPDGPV